MEILAPAGSWESLLAAVRCGADAVYLGGSHFNARRGAANFDEGQLASAVSFCHGRGVKVYLTVNILVLERELPVLRRALSHACACGVDAILVQDLAVAAIARNACPDLPLHASTQMSVHNPAGAKLLEELGFSRAVLARELSRDEIAELRAASTLELEAFVHGALCMSVSGQCYLSSVIGGRSGNRGLCAQPCRLPFACGNERHALSLKDNSLLGRMDELAAAGISCVKIEGRMKRPEYVAAAVTACREARDGKTPDSEALAAVFSRSGFTQGYFDGRRDASMFGIRQKEDVTSATAPLLKRYAALYTKEAMRVPVTFSLTLQAGKPAALTASDPDANSVTVSGELPQAALTAPTDEGRARAALSKTGGTPFFLDALHCGIGPGLMLPASALNDLRRRALDELLALREAPRPIPFSVENAEFACAVPARSASPSAPALRIRLSRLGQLPAALRSAAGLLFLPLSRWEDNTPGDPRLGVELPRYWFDGESALRDRLLALRGRSVTHALAGSPGALHLARELGFTVHGDATLNIVNAVALGEYERLGLTGATLSFEPELAASRGLGGTLPRGILAYGYLPLMALRACPVRAHDSSCPGRDCGFPELVDRKGKRFFIDCESGVASLYNCVPLWMCDKQDRLAGFDFVTLRFTRESPAETETVLRAWREGAPPPGEHTRGLYYRGIE